MKKFSAVAVFLLTTAAFAFGQNGYEQLKLSMVKDWERSKSYTLEYLEAMPASAYNFRPVDSINSFAQQMLHLARANFFFLHTATGDPMPGYTSAPLELRPGAASPDSVRYYVQESYDYCINAVKNSYTEQYDKERNFFGFKVPVYSLMQKALEHQAHHRGQTTIYIRLQGIRPPQEKLF